MTRDSNDTAVCWAKWKKNIERQLRFFGIEDPQLKKDRAYILRTRDRIADLDDSIPDPILEGEQNEYTCLIAKLDQHFLPKKNTFNFNFALNLVQQDDKPMAIYYARIREIAKKCSYTDENDAIRDHLIKIMQNNVIRVKAIRNNWSL